MSPSPKPEFRKDSGKERKETKAWRGSSSFSRKARSSLLPLWENLKLIRKNFSLKCLSCSFPEELMSRKRLDEWFTRLFIHKEHSSRRESRSLFMDWWKKLPIIAINTVSKPSLELEEWKTYLEVPTLRKTLRVSASWDENDHRIDQWPDRENQGRIIRDSNQIVRARKLYGIKSIPKEAAVFNELIN